MAVRPTGVERTFAAHELLVSKTDVHGKITYANDVFERISGYTLSELRGAPHSLVRHPDMPRVVFSLLWERIQSGREIFAYVNNLTKTGDHYWVFAHVTPSFDGQGRIVGYHSSRRAPARAAVTAVSELYARLRHEERAQERAAGLQAARAALDKAVATHGGYDRFLFQLTPEAP